MKKKLQLLLIALAVYLLLLCLLLAAERTADGAAIHSFGDALWYSLITMTTVGYGDLSPVTPWGRLIGILFALSSVGILAALIGIALHLVGEQLLPKFRLFFRRGRSWAVFSEANEESLTLAAALLRNEASCTVILPPEASGSLPGAVSLCADAAELIALHKNTSGLTFYFLGDDLWKNYTSALEAAKKQLPVYCMSSQADDFTSEYLHLFSRSEMLGRFYWQQYPLLRQEQTVVLIGCGENGSALLERALLINIFENGRRTNYHVFRDSAGFQQLHPVLGAALRPAGTGSDTLLFHAEAWETAHELLKSADRIIFCDDSDERNLADYDRLLRWFAVSGSVHLRLTAPVPNLVSFGACEDLFTPDFVMKDALNHRAKLMNEIYNRNASHPAAWQELSPFLKQSNIAAADHLPVKVRILLGDDAPSAPGSDVLRRAYRQYHSLLPEKADFFREIEHRRWMRFYQLYNWEASPQREDAMRRHPLLRPYEQLDEADRRKDDYAWEMLGLLSEAVPEEQL